jgi:hypothetical protein
MFLNEREASFIVPAVEIFLDKIKWSFRLNNLIFSPENMGPAFDENEHRYRYCIM